MLPQSPRGRDRLETSGAGSAVALPRLHPYSSQLNRRSWRDFAGRGLTVFLHILVLVAAVRCVVLMPTIDVIGKRHINTS